MEAFIWLMIAFRFISFEGFHLTTIGVLQQRRTGAKLYSSFQEAQCILAIDAAQYIVRQEQTVNVPASLAGGMRWIFEVFIAGFEKTEVKAVHAGFWNQVSPEKNAVRILEEEFAGRVGLAAEFRAASGDIHEEIRTRIQQLARIGEIFGVFRDVRSDEGGFSMACENAIALGQEFLLAEMRTVKTPLGMGGQFLVAFVVVVNGQEKGIRVGNVKHDRDVQFGGFLEDWCEALIVDAEQASISIANARAQILPEFEPAGAMLHEFFQAIDGPLKEAGHMQVLPVHPAVRAKTIGGCVVKPVNGSQRSFARPHRDVYNALDPAFIHDAQNVCRLQGVEVIVVVND